MKMQAGMSVGLAAALLMTAMGVAQQAQGHKNTQQRNQQQANNRPAGGESGKTGKNESKSTGVNPLFEAKDSVAQPKGGPGKSTTTNPYFKNNENADSMPTNEAMGSGAKPKSNGTATQANTGNTGAAATTDSTMRYRPGNNKTTRTPQANPADAGAPAATDSTRRYRPGNNKTTRTPQQTQRSTTTPQ